MEKRAEILFVGGDERVVKAADVLAGRGHTVTLTGFEAYGKEVQNAVPYGEAEKQIGGAELIVLPLPYTRDGKTVNAPFAKGAISLEELFAICGSKPVLGGMLPEKGIHADYYDEIMVLQNADVTAEAALLTAGARSGTTFAGGKALILGYGRIGKALANKLKALGCFVTVAARKEADRALARLSGHSAVDCVTAETLFAGMDFVFNTVPTELFGEEVFDALPERIPVVDLADGISGTRVIKAPGLPGKYAPEKAGEILAEAVERTWRHGGKQ